VEEVAPRVVLLKQWADRIERGERIDVLDHLADGGLRPVGARGGSEFDRQLILLVQRPLPLLLGDPRG
jgi:hypothetical protein